MVEPPPALGPVEALVLLDELARRAAAERRRHRHWMLALRHDELQLSSPPLSPLPTTSG